jgi:hypothetical protein
MKGRTGIQPQLDPLVLGIIDMDEQPSPSLKRSKKEKKFLESPQSTLFSIRLRGSPPRLRASRRLYLPMWLLKHRNREIFLPLRGLDSMDNRRRGPLFILAGVH